MDRTELLALWKAQIALCTADDMDGICLACLEDAYGVEPDAEGYACESCGARKVYGAEALLLWL